MNAQWDLGNAMVEPAKLIPAPNVTARRLRNFAIRTARLNQVSSSATEWVSPEFVWEAARGDLAVTNDCAREISTGYGRLTSLPDIRAVSGSDREYLDWLNWWLNSLTRSSLSISGSRQRVQLLHDNRDTLQFEINEALAFLRNHWAPAAVNVQLLVRNVVFVDWLGSGCMSDARVFGAIAICPSRRASTFTLAGELFAATAGLSFILQSQDASAIENGHRLRSFPGATLAELSEGLVFALVAAHRLMFACHMEYLGSVNPEYIRAARAELAGFIEVLQESAAWSNWGLDIYRRLMQLLNETELKAC